MFVVGLESLVTDLLGAQALDDGLGVVVRAAARLCSFQAPRNANFDRSVEVEYILGLANNLLEIDGLVNSSWKSINKVVLNNGYYRPVKI